MTGKQFKELWDSFSENTKEFMRDMWDHYDYNVEKTYIHKKRRFMIRRYNTMEQMCRVIVNWMQSSLDYGARTCGEAYSKYKTVESNHFWQFLVNQYDPRITELWNAATAKLMVKVAKDDLEKGLDRFDQEQMTFNEIKELFKPYGCLIKKKKELRLQWWAEFGGKTKGRHQGVPSYYPSKCYQLASFPCNQFKDKWLKDEIMKYFDEVSKTWLTWEESHSLRPQCTYATMLRRNETERIEAIRLLGQAK